MVATRFLRTRGVLQAFAPTSFAEPLPGLAKKVQRTDVFGVGLWGWGNPLPLAGGRAPIALPHSIPNTSRTSECLRAPGPTEKGGGCNLCAVGPTGVRGTAATPVGPAALEALGVPGRRAAGAPALLLNLRHPAAPGASNGKAMPGHAHCAAPPTALAGPRGFKSPAGRRGRP